MLHPPRRMADNVVIGFEPRLGHAWATGLAFSCWIQPASVRQAAPARQCQPLNASLRGPNRGIVIPREETMLERTTVQSPFYTAEHEAFRDVMRRFVAREIEPFANEWDEAGEFPRELYRKAAEIGLLGLGFPEEFGGVPADQFLKIVASQELAPAGAGGVSSSLMSHSIGAPPIARAARPEVKARVLPQVLSGQKISALAITETSGGSDGANLGP